MIALEVVGARSSRVSTANVDIILGWRTVGGPRAVHPGVEATLGAVAFSRLEVVARTARYDGILSSVQVSAWISQRH